MPKSKPDTTTKTPEPASTEATSPSSANMPKKGTAKKADAQPSTKISEAADKIPAARNSKNLKDGDTSPLRAKQIDPREREAMRAKIRAANFGNIVTVLSQSPKHKEMPLSEIIHLVVPPLLNNQFEIAEAQNKDTGFTIPVAVALWARVSEKVDERLVKNEDKPIRLDAREWRSGDIFWLIEMLGDKRFIRPMLDRLNKTVFKGKSVKYRTVNAEGVASINQMQTPET